MRNDSSRRLNLPSTCSAMLFRVLRGTTPIPEPRDPVPGSAHGAIHGRGVAAILAWRLVSSSSFISRSVAVSQLSAVLAKSWPAFFGYESDSPVVTNTPTRRVNLSVFSSNASL